MRTEKGRTPRHSTTKCFHGLRNNNESRPRMPVLGAPLQSRSAPRCVELWTALSTAVHEGRKSRRTASPNAIFTKPRRSPLPPRCFVTNVCCRLGNWGCALLSLAFSHGGGPPLTRQRLLLPSGPARTLCYFPNDSTRPSRLTAVRGPCTTHPPSSLPSRGRRRGWKQKITVPLRTGRFWPMVCCFFPHTLSPS